MFVFFAAHFPHFDEALVANKTFPDDAERGWKIRLEQIYSEKAKVIHEHDNFSGCLWTKEMTQREGGSVGSEWGNGWAVSQFREVPLYT